MYLFQHTYVAKQREELQGWNYRNISIVTVEDARLSIQNKSGYKLRKVKFEFLPIYQKILCF